MIAGEDRRRQAVRRVLRLRERCLGVVERLDDEQRAESFVATRRAQRVSGAFVTIVGAMTAPSAVPPVTSVAPRSIASLMLAIVALTA